MAKTGTAARSFVKNLRERTQPFFARENEELLAFRRELLSLAGERYVPPSSLAAVYQAFGETDAALDWMERSFEEGSNWIAYRAVDPWTEPLRDHPRCQSLLRRAGHR